MKIQDIKVLTKQELTELLLLNTKELKYQPDNILKLIEETFADYQEHRNYLLEKKKWWFNVFLYLFDMGPKLIEAIIDKMNWFDFIMWCEKNLLMNETIWFVFNSYDEFKKDQLSLSSIINNILNSIVDGLSEMQPDEIRLLFDELEDKIVKLPDIIKQEL